MNWIEFDQKRVLFSKLNSYKPTTIFQKTIVEFILDWKNGKEIFTFNTSGSTGIPKQINLSRKAMLASATTTIQSLDLKPNTNSLLCLDPNFIAGKMMIVRSLENKMNLIAHVPTSNPFLKPFPPIHFVALVPMQIHNILKDKKTKAILNNIEIILIGGGSLNKHDINELQNMNNNIYETFGMTETASHIALNKITVSYQSTYYNTLKKVNISTDNRNCLIVNSPSTEFKDLVTNDIVEIIDKNTFRWLGRIDDVINSGGIKIYPQLLEEAIGNIFSSYNILNRFFIFGDKDKVLGQKTMLAIEGNVDEKFIRTALKDNLKKYLVPKEIIIIEKFEKTYSGKIDKLKSINLYNYKL